MSEPAASPPRDARMSPREPRWYQSLYWRIALGLIAFLALMLAAEGALFLWTTDRIAGSIPARSPRRLAELVASDVGAHMAATPTLDLDQYVRDQYGHVFQGFVVNMFDGRFITNHDDISDELIDEARALAEVAGRRRGRGGWFGRGRGPGAGPGSGRGPWPERGAPPDGRDFEFPREWTPGPGGQFGGEPGPNFRQPPAFGRGGPDGQRALQSRGEFAPIMVNGAPVGTVIVLSDGPPFSKVLRELGPTMALMGGGVLIVGTTLIALLVFGPVRRRLKDVQLATERLGAGDLTARAPDAGGDEVAAVARSFNQMATELTSRARALARSDKARRQLLADVSHELMTPLTAMRGYIETLGMPELHLDPPTRERYVGIVTDETHRLERIIGDLLDLARLEGGGTTMRSDRVEVATLFERVAARHERELSNRRIELTRGVAAGAEWVPGDPDRLEQALQNLAANALRHTPDGGRIALSARGDSTHVIIGVQDTGPGIPDEHLPLIFDRFYKVDTARKAAAGSGLGLSIVKAIVERHGGSISARNDGGALFEIVLPRASP